MLRAQARTLADARERSAGVLAQECAAREAKQLEQAYHIAAGIVATSAEVNKVLRHLVEAFAKREERVHQFAVLQAAGLGDFLPIGRGPAAA